MQGIWKKIPAARKFPSPHNFSNCRSLIGNRSAVVAVEIRPTREEKNTWIDLDRERNFLQRNTTVKLWKWLKLWTNGIKTFWKTTASWVSKDKAFLKLPDPDLLKKRRHTMEGLPTSVRVNKTTESDSKVKETYNDVFRAYSNAFSLWSLMYKNTPILPRITLIHLWRIEFVSIYNNHVYF